MPKYGVLLYTYDSNMAFYGKLTNGTTQCPKVAITNFIQVKSTLRTTQRQQQKQYEFRVYNTSELKIHEIHAIAVAFYNICTAIEHSSPCVLFATACFF